MGDSLKYKLSSGKPSKALFFLKGFLKQCIPGWYYRNSGEKLIQSLNKRKDKAYILERVAYYNKVEKQQVLSDNIRHEHHGRTYTFTTKRKNILNRLIKMHRFMSIVERIDMGIYLIEKL